MSDTPRAKLSAKHPRPAERTRAPVRPGGIGAVQRRRPSETAAQNTAPNTAPTTPARNTTAAPARQTKAPAGRRADTKPGAERKPRPAPPASPGRATKQSASAKGRASSVGAKRPASAAPVRATRQTGQSPASQQKRHGAARPNDEGMVRLSKRMSELGICSRREADEWIVKGWVRVDGAVVSELGSRIRPEQSITVERAARNEQAQRVTFVLHKPIGYVSGQPEDDYPPAAALLTAANRWQEDDARIRFSPQQLRGLAPAGRLDIDSTGMLILTQDGRIARQLIGADSDIDKEYLVRVAYQTHEEDVRTHFPAALLDKLRHGLSLDDVPLKPAEVEWQNPEQLRFVLREGKKRQIRRMCELVGLRVTGLKRIRMGRIKLGNLPQGQWRYLRPDEQF
ncbi:MAG: pseudouridine synthase [Pandoraea sp.]|nr:MAG: pseudouridine synthase [Pandoraea sp.]TAM16217.1 MAG: pseudouridine synthase [Pandoraea sp.]